MAIDAYLKLQGIKGETLDAFFRTKGVIEVQLISMGDTAQETEWIKQFRNVLSKLDGPFNADRRKKEQENTDKFRREYARYEAEMKRKKESKNKNAPTPKAPQYKAASGGPRHPLSADMDVLLSQYKSKRYPAMLEKIKDIRSKVKALPGGAGASVDPELKRLRFLTLVENYALTKARLEEAQDGSGGEEGEEQEEDYTKAKSQEPQQRHNVVLTKNFDSASPDILKKYCAWKLLSKDESATPDQALIKTGKAWARKSIGAFFIEWEFRNIFITELSWSTDAATGNLTESLTLRASSVQAIYRPQDSTGAFGTDVPSQWDFQANEASFQSVEGEVFS